MEDNKAVLVFWGMFLIFIISLTLIHGYLASDDTEYENCINACNYAKVHDGRIIITECYNECGRHHSKEFIYGELYYLPNCKDTTEPETKTYEYWVNDTTENIGIIETPYDHRIFNGTHTFWYDENGEIIIEWS